MFPKSMADLAKEGWRQNERGTNPAGLAPISWAPDASTSLSASRR